MPWLSAVSVRFEGFLNRKYAMKCTVQAVYRECRSFCRVLQAKAAGWQPQGSNVGVGLEGRRSRRKASDGALKVILSMGESLRMRTSSLAAARVFDNLRKKLVAGLLTLCLVSLAAYMWSSQSISMRLQIDPGQIVQYGDKGPNAYTCPLPAWAGQGDTSGKPARSKLKLTEDGIPLGLPHSIHEKIWLEGKGRYSHWNDSLIFSSTDNSDPRINGKTYVITGLSQQHPFLAKVSLVMSGIGLVCWAAVSGLSALLLVQALVVVLASLGKAYSLDRKSVV